MFLGINQGPINRTQALSNCSTCWPNLQLGFKLVFLLSLLVNTGSLLYSPLTYLLCNLVQQTIESFQLWRLFSSFLVSGSGIASIINLLINLYILYMILPNIQRKYSTIYSIIEVITQLFISNSFLVVLGYPLVYLGIVSNYSVAGFGMLPIVMNFLCQSITPNPEENTKLCFFPCLIPSKYIPWCLTLLLCLLGNPVIPTVLYCSLGFYQHIIRKRSLLPLPLAIYRKLDSILPEFIKNNKGYIKVLTVETQLIKICSNGCCGDTNTAESQLVNEMIKRVQVIGGGTKIGGSQTNNSVDLKAFKSHWQKKDLQQHQDNPQQQNISTKKQPNLSQKQAKQVNSRSTQHSEVPMQTITNSSTRFQQQNQYVASQNPSLPAAHQQQLPKKQKKTHNNQKHYPLVEDQDPQQYS